MIIMIRPGLQTIEGSTPARKSVLISMAAATGRHEIPGDDCQGGQLRDRHTGRATLVGGSKQRHDLVGIEAFAHLTDAQLSEIE